jgi:uncharacterized protein DUF2188
MQIADARLQTHARPGRLFAGLRASRSEAQRKTKGEHIVAVARRLSLSYNVETDTWDLTDERTSKLVKSFLTKEAATRKGVLESHLGKQGGSVVIRKRGGVFEEERRYAGR